ncbi:MAG: hypothetical protein ACREVM_04880 [Burkholderiales bacterium]
MLLLIHAAARAYSVLPHAVAALGAIVEGCPLSPEWVMAQSFQGDPAVPENRWYLIARALAQQWGGNAVESESVQRAAQALGVLTTQAHSRKALGDSRTATQRAAWWRRAWDRVRQR